MKAKIFLSLLKRWVSTWKTQGGSTNKRKTHGLDAEGKDACAPRQLVPVDKRKEIQKARGSQGKSQGRHLALLGLGGAVQPHIGVAVQVEEGLQPGEANSW
jgi:hypothetical protein